ncbi:CapA family protein [Ruminococcus albus]|uniref:Poly-gamma-glutamate synthesis protein (Capsule biosynthesis protein) n=1 Tax=Ruminococcus albus TaxID=1264 RepID=A0A1H7GJL6_RUMAL|nr:CapA family protein [Ruminococcus albus]SEK38264.1 poly-gamma-glutamate synthesis protein (capsule biosynthesis protein) [Ruminococcus albus]
MKIKTIPFILAAAMLTASCGKLMDTSKKPEADTETNPAVSTEAQEEGKTSGDTAGDTIPADENSAAVSAPEEDPADENKTGKTVVHLACAGDNLIHDNIYVEAQQEDGSYDFSKCYAPCKKLIEGTDVAILNQETLVNDAFEPSTFPMFSTPTEVGDAVLDFGFNVISMSNNHVLDKFSDGLISSLDYWDSKGVVHYGAYRDEDDSENIRTMEVNGIKFAFLGYMEHTNGIFLGDGDAGKVVYLSDEETVKRQIMEADNMADVVVVSCHYGTEVLNDLNDMQLKLTPKLVEWGADLIIGTQAHALSTCTYLDKPDGGQAFCYYGLGNFFSTMFDGDNPDGQFGRSIIGIFGKLDVVKDYDNGGAISFENVKAIPVISHYEGESWDSMWFNCAVYPYGDYTDDMLYRHMMYQRAGVNRNVLQNYINYIPEEFLAYE